MSAWNQRITKLAKRNTDFRREVATSAHAQIVLMCLQPGEDIGEETHADTDQVFCIVKGAGKIVLDGASEPIKKGSLVLVPAGLRHNLVNDGDESLRLFTMYAPPGTVHPTRKDARAAESH